MTKSGHNITNRFEIMFNAGLIVLSADIVNTNFINIYSRLKVQVEE